MPTIVVNYNGVLNLPRVHIGYTPGFFSLELGLYHGYRATRHISEVSNRQLLVLSFIKRTPFSKFPTIKPFPKRPRFKS